jgi:extracellular matrix regulatory protein A
MMLLNVGFGNFVAADRVLAILNPESSPMKRLREEAKSRGYLVDGTQGRKTRALVLLDSGNLILSGVQADTLANRLESLVKAGDV